MKQKLFILTTTERPNNQCLPTQRVRCTARGVIYMLYLLQACAKQQVYWQPFKSFVS